jgi:hypothetical protein
MLRIGLILATPLQTMRRKSAVTVYLEGYLLVINVYLFSKMGILRTWPSFFKLLEAPSKWENKHTSTP